MNRFTHYDTLRVDRTASLSHMRDAYDAILRENDNDETKTLPPFARSQAQRRVRDAMEAWKVLENPTTRRAYDATLPILHSYQDTQQSSPSFDEPPSSSPDCDDADDEGSGVEDVDERSAAQYRFGRTVIGTEVDMKISRWRLSLHISSKFIVDNDGVTELSIPCEGPETISFEISLTRDLTANEHNDSTVNEGILRIQSIPEDLHVSKVQTIFKELTRNSASVIVTITACFEEPQSVMPWVFGFDFDMNAQPAARGKCRGTCLILSVEEPTEHLKTTAGLDTPDCALKWDKKLRATAWCDLGCSRVMKLIYGDIQLWRLAAVGYKVGSVC